MYESSDEFVERLMSLLQSEIKIVLDEPIIHKILYSTHRREESCDLLGKEISGHKLGYFLASYNIAKEVGHFGIRIKGLIILGKLDLDSVNIVFPLVFKDCIFKDVKDEKGGVNKGDIILRDDLALISRTLA